MAEFTTYTLSNKNDLTEFVTLNPEWNIKEKDEKVETRHPTKDGSEFIYKSGSFRVWDINLRYVTDIDRNLLNRWWSSNTTLVWGKGAPWNVFGMTHDDETYDFLQMLSNVPGDIRLDDNGSYIYFLTLNKVRQGSLADLWQIETTTDSGKELDMSSEMGTTVTGMVFGDGGRKLYAISWPATIYQYTLGFIWDLDSGAYSGNSLDVSSDGLVDVRGVAFNSDGTKMYVVDDDTTIIIYQYTLSTAWDVSTATYASKSFDLGSPYSQAGGFYVDPDGENFYVGCVDASGSPTEYLVRQYEMGTAEDISTASLVYSEDVTDYNSQVGVHLDPTGSFLFTLDQTNRLIHRFTIADYDADLSAAGDIRIVNKSRPINMLEKPYNNLWSGKLKVRTT